jgi:hypothetical protein
MISLWKAVLACTLITVSALFLIVIKLSEILYCPCQTTVGITKIRNTITDSRLLGLIRQSLANKLVRIETHFTPPLWAAVSSCQRIFPLYTGWPVVITTGQCSPWSLPWSCLFYFNMIRRYVDSSVQTVSLNVVKTNQFIILGIHFLWNYKVLKRLFCILSVTGGRISYAAKFQQQK